MNNMQATTPGFVLTSLSFRQTENKNTPHQQEANTEPHSSIAKFDYCLPPEEADGNTTGKKPAA